ncbi:hypothetical protein ACFQV2_09945 [Actinokineospora soli]|uniref:Uncharacterized protein n=1 Tax=Actinokineospora soli TaxID=1048753 RepID=A0ABW2TJ98_9PSEU
MKLRPWLVNGLVTTAVVPEPDDVRLGASARYLCVLREFAEDLVGRGRVLPAVTSAGVARWRPAPTGADSARLARLREAMPPALRADGSPAPRCSRRWSTRSSTPSRGSGWVISTSPRAAWSPTTPWPRTRCWRA